MRAALVLVVVLALAGCLGAKGGPATLAFTATGGKVSPGWAYDGAGLVPADAALDGTLNDAANTGLVNVTFSYHASKYVVAFDTFAQAAGKDFQDGGVAFGIDEHGSTTHGDAALPKLHALAAAWGSASVLRDGAPAADKPWTAHLMISSDTVRGPDGKIANAAGAAYDPAKPDDAKVTRGDPQAIFFIKHPLGEDHVKPPVAKSDNLTCTGPACSVGSDVAVDRGAHTATITVTIKPAQGPIGAGSGTVRVTANGTDAAAPVPFQYAPPNAPTPITVTIEEGKLTGPIVVQIAGQGAFTAQVDSLVEYDEHPFLVVTWNEITST